MSLGLPTHEIFVFVAHLARGVWLLITIIAIISVAIILSHFVPKKTY